MRCTHLGGDMRAALLHLSFGLVLLAAEAKAQAPVRIPISINAQNLCTNVSGSGCTSGGSLAVHFFNDPNGFSGWYRAEVVDGKLTYTINASITNSSASSVGLNATQDISFLVPQVSSAGVPLPTTLVTARGLTEAGTVTPQTVQR